MVDEKILMEILDSREVRARKQKELIEKYRASLISFSLNIPGRKKDSELYRAIHREGLSYLEKAIRDKKIRLIYQEKEDKNTGSEAFLVLDEDALEIKKLTIEIEEIHPLGRIFDMDVFDREGNQIGRSQIGVRPRTCLLCHKEVRLCMREKNHSYEELISRIEELGKKYM